MSTWKIAMIVLIGTMLPIGVGLADERPISTDGTDPKTWDRKMDGPSAAPVNHKIIFEDENLRIITVTVLPGSREPYHAHFRCSLMVYDSPAKFTDYDRDGDVAQRVSLASIPWQSDQAPKSPPLAFLQPPQSVHSIANNDTHAMRLIRIEFKKGCEMPPQ
jgi:quercetin dioxygenase-like cupin family protein